MNKKISRRFYVIDGEKVTNDFLGTVEDMGITGLVYFSTYIYSDADVETVLATDEEIEELQIMWDACDMDSMDEIEKDTRYIDSDEDLEEEEE